MKLSIGVLVLTFLFSIPAFSQGDSGPKSAPKEKPATGPLAPLDAAKATLAVHGGDKLKKMRSLVMKGAVDLNTFGQSIPGAFSTAVSGEKYFFEINSAVQQLKQVFDGRETYSSIQGFSLPPVTSLGLPLLAKVGDSGFAVTALPETAKKKKGFRVTTPEGFYTDFFTDDKTNQIKGYESAFELEGRVVTTSVDVDEFQTVEGIVVPKKYSQRFDLGPITAYANFRTREILINTTIEDSAFALPK